MKNITFYGRGILGAFLLGLIIGGIVCGSAACIYTVHTYRDAISAHSSVEKIN